MWLARSIFKLSGKTRAISTQWYRLNSEVDAENAGKIGL
jgi:hypothetical protein